MGRVRRRRVPHRIDADSEILDGDPFVRLHDAVHQLEIAGQEFDHFLRRALLGDRREVAYVGEQDGDLLALAPLMPSWPDKMRLRTSSRGT